MITLLKKGGKSVWEGLDDYRPITLLNTELKILARVLANRLQLVISDLIGPEQAYAVKGKSTQDNLHFIWEVLEDIEDGTEAALINLDHSKAFNWVDHRFLASVLETAGFKREFCKWINMMYHKPQVQVNRRNSRTFAIERLVREGCPLSPLLNLRVRWWYHGLCIPLPGYKGYEEGDCWVRTNCKSQGQFWQKWSLWLGAWRSSDNLPEPFRWSEGPVRILGVWFGPDLQLERNWSEVQAKVDAQVGTWLPRK